MQDIYIYIYHLIKFVIAIYFYFYVRTYWLQIQRSGFDSRRYQTSEI
jgi:hypothetical protein